MCLQENTCARVSLLIKLQAKSYNVIKKGTMAQVLSCEICDIFKKTFSADQLRATASEECLNPSSNATIEHCNTFLFRYVQ